MTATSSTSKMRVRVISGGGERDAFFKIFDFHKQANISFLILLSWTLTLGLFFSSLSSAEIYKYVGEDGVIHLTNVPNGKYNLVLKEGWVWFQLGTDFEKYDPLIWKAAKRYSVDYALVKAVIKAESNFDPLAISRAGAKGLMQLMPGTASGLGVNDSFHPADNIEGGVRYLSYLLDLFKGDLHFFLPWQLLMLGKKVSSGITTFLLIGRPGPIFRESSGISKITTVTPGNRDFAFSIILLK